MTERERKFTRALQRAQAQRSHTSFYDNVSGKTVVLPPATGLLDTALMNFTAPASIPFDGTWLPVSGVDGGIYVKGVNWDVWRDAALAMPGSSASEVVEDVSSNYQRVQFKGQTLVNHLACAKLAMLGHGAPPEYINAIKVASGGRTKVGLYFFNFEGQSHVQATTSWLRNHESVSMAHLATSTGQIDHAPRANPNLACANIDMFETWYDSGPVDTNPGDTHPAGWGDPAPCGTQLANNSTNANFHYWFANMRTGTQTYIESWWSVLTTDILARYGVGEVDFILVDLVQDRPQWQTASNPDSALTDAAYQATWKAFFSRAATFTQTTGTKVMGNCSIYQPNYTPTEVPFRYGEHFFHDEQNFQNATSEDWTTIQSRLQQHGAALQFSMPTHQIKSSGAVYTARSYAATSVDAWTGTENGPGGASGSWTQIRDLVFNLQMQNRFYAVAGRTSTAGFALHWHPAFKSPGQF